jgi:hypothetical protein
MRIKTYSMYIAIVGIILAVINIIINIVVIPVVINYYFKMGIKLPDLTLLALHSNEYHVYLFILIYAAIQFYLNRKYGRKIVSNIVFLIINAIWAIVIGFGLLFPLFIKEGLGSQY